MHVIFPDAEVLPSLSASFAPDLPTCPILVLYTPIGPGYRGIGISIGPGGRSQGSIAITSVICCCIDRVRVRFTEKAYAVSIVWNMHKKKYRNESIQHQSYTEW